ncbi:MAG: protein tyrosine phosphatase [Clostridia bacterium]|nr:protein tyrosine phosphatase [Clostridia bacterium]
MKKLSHGIKAVLVPALVLCLACGAALAESPSQQLRQMPEKYSGVFLYKFWRNDIPDGTANELPVNFRMMTSAFHDYGEFGKKAGMDADYQPDLTGLDTLHASGSGFFNESQFANMVEAIRAQHDGPVYDIDLRREPHGLFNGVSVTWYSKYNLYRMELSAEEADREAKEFMHAAAGTAQVLYNSGDYPDPSKTIPIQVESVLTEDELCAKYGVNYVHITCNDHIFPSDEEIDTFVKLVRSLPENAWVHLHCSAGKGRTTTFLALYDMMRNPGVSLRDVAYRQAYLGTMYVLARGSESQWHQPYDDERADMMPYLYDYVQQNHETGFAALWSEYRAAKGF